MAYLIVVFVFLSLICSLGRAQTSADGDVVDCVNKYKQKAFEHHRLTNHKLQEAPSEFPTITESYKKGKWRTKEAQLSTAQCPQGTIPVRRDGATLTRTEPDSPSSTPGHEYALVSTKSPSKIYGAKAKINVWASKVEEGSDEMSIGQIWLTTGEYKTDNVNTIEIGYQVYPMFYLDNNPRLFIFWTCPGFIQTSGSIVLGGSITPISSFGGSQSEITVLVWKDPKQGNWWLSIGSLVIGYWPAELFRELGDYATTVEYGGEITNSLTSGRHTTTEMGTGRFSDEGVGKVSYIRNMEFVDYKNNLKSIEDLERKPTNPNEQA
ncbi:hypothetical protein AALP_AA4G217000 [Arabis alpina]|uniref:Neprosin PEP catalytic domain-containing protein n=1 Tax=Arabis alpina TaxID=50452 RepID=A0A087H4S9_ARAAL|nr:hypothetical protein AALP_AA4G217000 [Arabis alpina]